MADDVLDQPLGSVPQEPVYMTRETLQSLRRLVAQHLPDEQKHFEESGKPFDHVYHDWVAVRWAIRQFDFQQEQERREDEALNELAVRLSQG